MKQFVVRSIEGDTIDAICYRYFGATGAITEQVLVLNRHIATIGPVLPINTAVVLPASAAAVNSQSSGTKLWD